MKYSSILFCFLCFPQSVFSQADSVSFHQRNYYFDAHDGTTNQTVTFNTDTIYSKIKEVYENTKKLENEVDNNFSVMKKTIQDGDKKTKEEFITIIDKRTEEINKKYQDISRKLDSLEKRVQQLEQKK